MPSELRPLARRLGLSPSRDDAGVTRVGAVGRVELVAGLTGVGMEAGARAARRMLEASSPDHLVVVGIAGGIGASVAVGDLVVPERVLDLDSGDELLPTGLGGLPRGGTLASSDRLLTSPDEARRLAARGVVAIDMETAAVAGVCHAQGCPWSVFRAVSDRADDGDTDPAVLGLLRPDGTPDLGAVLRLVVRRPRRIAQLARLARGAGRATRVAASAASAAIRSLPDAGPALDARR